MEKVKLPREVAKTIEYYMNPLILTKYGVLSAIMTEANKETVRARLILEMKYGDSECWDILMQALVNGYEIEKTPEDDVREYFLLARDNLANPSSYYGNEVTCATVIHVLNLLNIKIEGVNT